ncbi:MAG TPA: hypothetical protein VLV88_14365 [Terriglobales bacterium]|nr:hypothetical protein [Terriglobales bacterium]
MPGPIEFMVWCLGFASEVAVVVCAIRAKVFKRYLPLNLYMAASATVELLRYRILNHYGFTSSNYFYFYYYSDALLTITLFLALISLFVIVFREMSAERYVIYGATLLLGGTALFSYLVVQQSSNRLLTHFVVEMSQNLYFVGLVLTYVLWGAILKLRETRTQLIQLVLSLGVYFSLFAVNYAVRNLFPPFSSLSISLLQVLGCFLPVAWAYAFWRIPKDARLVPARLAVIPR